MTLKYPLELPLWRANVTNREFDISTYSQHFDSPEHLLQEGPYAVEYDMCPDDLSPEHRLTMLERIVERIQERSLLSVRISASVDNYFFGQYSYQYSHCLKGFRPGQLTNYYHNSPFSFENWHLLLPPGTQLVYELTRQRRSLPIKRSVGKKIITITENGISKDAHLDPTGTNAALRFQRIHTAVSNLQIGANWKQNLDEALMFTMLPPKEEWPENMLTALNDVRDKLTRVQLHEHETSPLDCCLPVVKQTRALLEQQLKKSNYDFVLGADLSELTAS